MNSELQRNLKLSAVAEQSYYPHVCFGELSQKLENNIADALLGSLTDVLRYHYTSLMCGKSRCIANCAAINL